MGSFEVASRSPDHYPFNKMPTFSRDTLYAPLRTARVYNLFQSFVGGDRDRTDFVRKHVVFRSDEKVVDAGCGPGRALEFLPLVNYFGFDPNPDYIRLARSRYGNRGHFVCGDASNPQVQEMAQGADVFLSLGVLHHLADNQISEMLALAQRSLHPSGRFIFYEPCFSAN